ncbi:MAG: thioredoxin [Bacillota bacterium]|nr:thioredoxin [Bacillota bacterium]REJ36175.1 MAG: thioredoxin [Bacillota bacterium]
MAAVMNLTDAEFDQKVLKSETPVVVDFWAPWCGPCRRLAPILEEVAAEMGDRLQVYKLNTDENPQSPGRYGVMSIPTLIVFRNGQEVDRIVGALPKEILREKLEAAIS